jgi:hypothetical protein
MNQAAVDIRYAATDLVELTHTSAQLPEPLIRSGLLFAPARMLPSTMERLQDRNHGRYVSIQLPEGASLIDAAQAGYSAARKAQATLEISSKPTVETELSIRPPGAGISRREPEIVPSLGGPELL